jgi:hypothetical protein
MNVCSGSDWRSVTVTTTPRARHGRLLDRHYLLRNVSMLFTVQ